MNASRKALPLLFALTVLAPARLDAQVAVRTGRGAVTRATPDRTGAAVTVRRPSAEPAADRNGPSGMRLPVFDANRRRGHFAQRTVFIPYTTAFVRDRARSDADLLNALEEVRDAALDAREAALAAREAALDARAATSRTSRTPPATGVLHWKPGGITPVDPESNRPAEPPPASADAAARVRLDARTLSPWIVPVPPPSGTAFVPLWVSFDCTAVQQQAQQRQQQERRRFPWGLGWLQRYGRDVQVERGTVSAPSFYMRSPLLYGLYRRPDCPPADAVQETCAEVTVVGDDDAAIAFDVPLPQLEAHTARALRDAIRAGLADEETVILRTTDGEEFDLMPGAVREIGTAACVGN